MSEVEEAAAAAACDNAAHGSFSVARKQSPAREKRTVGKHSKLTWNASHCTARVKSDTDRLAEGVKSLGLGRGGGGGDSVVTDGGGGVLEGGCS